MKEIIINCPINQLSFGNFSYNILREIYELGYDTSIFPISNKVDISVYDKTTQDFSNWLQDCIHNRNKKVRRDQPSLKIWHINGSESKISNNSTLFTFHESSQATESEVSLCNLHSNVVFSSSYSSGIFKESGVTISRHAPLGFDRDFTPSDEYKIKNKIHFGLMGKWENRKHTSKIIRIWAEKYGNIDKFQLTCCVNNSFLTEDKIEKLKSIALNNKEYHNINFLPWISKNSQVNSYLNSIDIDLGGMSGAEGWNLPVFNSTCLGKWGIVLNSTSHKDWANKENSILIEPSGTEDIEDGVFFFKNSEFNQGNKYTFHEFDLLNAMEDAISRVEDGIINTRGIDLGKKLTYKNCFKEIEKYIFEK
jgi:hypothetical protein